MLRKIYRKIYLSNCFSVCDRAKKFDCCYDTHRQIAVTTVCGEGHRDAGGIADSGRSRGRGRGRNSARMGWGLCAKEWMGREREEFCRAQQMAWWPTVKHIRYEEVEPRHPNHTWTPFIVSIDTEIELSPLLTGTEANSEGGGV